MDVELEPDPPACRPRHVLQLCAGECADADRGPGRARAARRFRLGTRMKAALRGDRSEQDRELEPLTEELQPRVDRAHVDEHARFEPNRVERLTVPPKRDLVGRSLGEVVPGRARQALLCEWLELENVDGP